MHREFKWTALAAACVAPILLKWGTLLTKWTNCDRVAPLFT